MAILQHQITVNTAGRGTQEITPQLQHILTQWRAEHALDSALLNIFIKHTSASLLVTENADPTVRSDLEIWLAQAVQDGHPSYQHNYEGPDDMSGHIRTVLTETSLNIPVSKGALNLGTWQGVYLYEHRQLSFERQIVLTLTY